MSSEPVAFWDKDFRDKIKTEAARLTLVMDGHEEKRTYDLITNGRVSGMLLALSYLEDFIERDT